LLKFVLPAKFCQTEVIPPSLRKVSPFNDGKIASGMK
jgi:hypothetical protein